MEILKNFISGENIRLDEQLKFVAEIDKMTSVFRRTILLDRSRAENDAEHSWHIAVMALLFQEYALEKINALHSVEMLLVHDLIEIYAGDTFAYDAAGNATKAERENKAADKLFAMLPADQGTYIRSLWEEFDQRLTPDAKYANCLDRLQPFLHNILTEGYTWRTAEIPPDASQVEDRMAIIRDFMPEVYKWVAVCIEHATTREWLQKS